MYPALVKLFPNFTEEVRAAGGSIAPPQPVVYRGGGVVKVPLTANEWDTRQLYISREVLEALLRKLVLRDFPNVTSLHGSAADLTAEGDTVKSVTVRLPDGCTQNIEGSVFLDCTGTTNGSEFPTDNYFESSGLTYYLQALDGSASLATQNLTKERMSK